MISGQLDRDVAAPAQLIYQRGAGFSAVFLLQALHHGLIGVGIGDEIQGEVDQFRLFCAEPHIHKLVCHPPRAIKPPSCLGRCQSSMVLRRLMVATNRSRTPREMRASKCAGSAAFDLCCSVTALPCWFGDGYLRNSLRPPFPFAPLG